MSLQELTFLSPLFSETFLNNFHFIRPWWLLAFLVLFLALYLIKRARVFQSPWQHFMPEHLTKVLLEENNEKQKSNLQSDRNRSRELTSSINRFFWIKPFIIGSCVIIALAGPAWQKLPQPVYQLERGSVLIMDMSYSMYSTDLKPNRLTRARFKANDLLTVINEGEVGLIAYAGDAFTISPLTQDIKNIELLLPSLSPDIMPVLGANALAALTLADNTLKSAGHLQGDIYWFTDDIDNEEVADIYAWSNRFGHRLNILGIGTEAGAPIKLNSGELLKDNQGAIVVPKLPENKLSALAQRGSGFYSTITSNDNDINTITAHLRNDLLNNSLPGDDNENKKEQKSLMQGDQFQEQGPWLLLIAIPFVLSYFRRGSALLSLATVAPYIVSFALLSASLVSAPANAAATESSQDTQPHKNDQGSSLWKDLWQTKNQQAQRHFNAAQYSQAANAFSDKEWQGSAHYKAGNYADALKAFEHNNDAQGLYNQGNALAQMQQYDEAIERYKKALAQDPNFADAKSNLAKVEQAKKQQKQQQKQQNGDNSQQNDNEKSEDEKNDDPSEQNDQQSNDGEQEQGQNQKSDSSNEQSPSEQNSPQDQNESPSQNNDSNQQNDPKESDAQNQDEIDKEKQAQEKAQQQATPEQKSAAEQKSDADIASDKKAQETDQKHQQLLKKITDDPHLLLRNKMRLEYQKRRHDSQAQGVNKKW